MAQYVLNEENCLWNKMMDLDATMPDSGHRAFVYKKDSNEILTYGGGGAWTNRGKNLTFMEIFNIKKRMESTKDIGGIQDVIRKTFVYVVTMDGKYMIIFCPFIKQRGDTTKRIYIWNLENMECKKSSIYCPFYDHMECVIVSDSVRALTMTFGFIRDCHQQNNKLPHVNDDIIRIIGLYNRYEIVHLLSHGYYTYDNIPLHYKIAVNDIFSNIDDSV